MYHHGWVKQRVERQLKQIVEDGDRLQPLRVPVPGEVVVSSLLPTFLLSTSNSVNRVGLVSFNKLNLNYEVLMTAMS